MPIRVSFPTLFLVICFVLGWGTSLAQQQRSQAQLSLLQSEWEQSPDNMQIALVLAGALQQSGQADKATSVIQTSMAGLEKRMKTEGDSAQLQYLLGTGALFLRQHEKALQAFQFALSLEPEREEIHQGMIRALLNLGRNQEASDALQLATTLFPESEGIKGQLSETYERMGSFQEAIPILEELRVLNPGDPGLFNRLLTAYVSNGNAEKARPLFNQLVEAGSISELEASLHIFRIHVNQGDLRSARMELQTTTKVGEGDPRLDDAFRQYYALQAAEAEEDGNYRRAILFWQRALERDPDDWQTKYRYALAQAELNNHQEALDLYLPLLEDRPALPGFYADLSDTLMALDRLDAAARVIQLGMKVAQEKSDVSSLQRLQQQKDEIISRTQSLPGATP